MEPAGEGPFRLLAELLEQRFGIQWDETRRDLLESKLQVRLSALRLSCLHDYYHYLNHHPEAGEEMASLRRAITNNETYFFREQHQFDILAHHVAPARPTGAPLRVLSAGCSSGEEVYSIVIALQAAGLELSGRSWKVDGCDLNPARVAQARAGVYGASALRACDAATRLRHFDRADGGDGLGLGAGAGAGAPVDVGSERWAIKARHRRNTDFFEANLVAPPHAWTWARGTYDAIFCRNVLIYFSPRAFDSAISLFARLLAPGGTLFLGHSESLIDRRRDFQPVSIGGSIVYRRAEET